MLIPLIQNETLKILRRSRFAVVIGILLAILAIVTYSQYRQLRSHANRNWRAEIQQRIANYQNRVRQGRINETWARSMRAEINRLQFYLDHDIEPEQPTAPALRAHVRECRGIPPPPAARRGPRQRHRLGRKMPKGRTSCC